MVHDIPPHSDGLVGICKIAPPRTWAQRSISVRGVVLSNNGRLRYTPRAAKMASRLLAAARDNVPASAPAFPTKATWRQRGADPSEPARSQGQQR